MNKKEGIYIIFFIIGISSIVVGILNSRILSIILPKDVILTNYGWLIIFGMIFIITSLILLFVSKNKSFKKYSTIPIIEIILIVILIITSAGVSGLLYGQYQKTLLISTENIQRIDEQLKMWDQMEKDNPFYSKKIIIRDDDIGDFLYYPSLEWISNVCINKDIKITLAVIPATLVNNSETVDYLNQLDRKYFEFATHGYEHTIFQGVPYEKQYSLIDNGTKIIEEYLNYTPFTFVPPKGSGDVSTTKALRFLGYHSITDMIGYPSYVVNFRSDLAYDKQYTPVKHQSLEDFKNSFDIFYNSSDEFYIVFLHDWTFLDNEGKLDEVNASEFEQAIDYIKGKNVQFMTIEEGYQWYIDESRIRTGMVNNYEYFIDLRACSYNHTIRFNSPISWNGEIRLIGVTTENEELYYQNIFEFDGTKGHLYEIRGN